MLVLGPGIFSFFFCADRRAALASEVFPARPPHRSAQINLWSSSWCWFLASLVLSASLAPATAGPSLNL